MANGLLVTATETTTSEEIVSTHRGVVGTEERPRQQTRSGGDGNDAKEHQRVHVRLLKFDLAEVEQPDAADQHEQRTAAQ